MTEKNYNDLAAALLDAYIKTASDRTGVIPEQWEAMRAVIVMLLKRIDELELEAKANEKVEVSK